MFDSSGNPCASGVGGCFVPPHPDPLPEERESAGAAPENLDVAVGVPASLSFVAETYDNQTRPYYQRTGVCFSLSLGVPWGEGRGDGEQAPAVLAASALDLAPEDPPDGCMALSHSSFQACGSAGVATRNADQQ